MTCQEAEPHLIDDLMGGSLAPTIAAHVDGCAHCLEKRAELQQTHSMLRQALVARPPASLRAGFYEQLAHLQAQAVVTPRRRTFSYRGLRSYAMAGAFVVVFLFGFAVAMQYGTSPTESTLILGQLNSISPSDRLMAAYSSLTLEQPDGAIRDALLKALQNDKNVNVRVAAIEALAPFARQVAVQQAVLSAMVNDSSPNVQIAALHFAADQPPVWLESALEQLLTRTDLESLIRSEATTLLNSRI